MECSADDPVMVVPRVLKLRQHAEHVIYMLTNQNRGRISRGQAAEVR